MQKRNMIGRLSHAPSQDLVHNPGMCCDQELNWQPFGSVCQTIPNPLSHTSQGQICHSLSSFSSQSQFFFIKKPEQWAQFPQTSDFLTSFFSNFSSCQLKSLHSFSLILGLCQIINVKFSLSEKQTRKEKLRNYLFHCDPSD